MQPDDSILKLAANLHILCACGLFFFQHFNNLRYASLDDYLQKKKRVDTQTVQLFF
jgi:hypothetical protein